MNVYERELMARSREAEVAKAAEFRRVTTGERRPLHFWLVATLRAWIIGAWR